MCCNILWDLSLKILLLVSKISGKGPHVVAPNIIDFLGTHLLLTMLTTEVPTATPLPRYTRVTMQPTIPTGIPPWEVLPLIARNAGTHFDHLKNQNDPHSDLLLCKNHFEGHPLYRFTEVLVWLTHLGGIWKTLSPHWAQASKGKI